MRDEKSKWQRPEFRGRWREEVSLYGLGDAHPLLIMSPHSMSHVPYRGYSTGDARIGTDANQMQFAVAKLIVVRARGRTHAWYKIWMRGRRGALLQKSCLWLRMLSWVVTTVDVRLWIPKRLSGVVCLDSREDRHNVIIRICYTKTVIDTFTPYHE